VNDLSTVLILLACAAVIYVACEYFVNGIEWLGLRLGVNENAVGTVLAAFGTALPESVVTFVAVVLGRSPAAREIGIGAAIGGPLVLSTIAYSVVGVCVLAFGRRARVALLRSADLDRLAGDQAWFLVIFAAKVTLGFLAFAHKPWLGAVFLLAYGLYTWREVTRPAAAAPLAIDIEPLKIRAGDPSPALAWALLQTIAALLVIYLASQLFVRELQALQPALGLSAQLTALLLSPIATELPETLNAVIWLRQGKTGLALGNISGAMLIQATIPSALGIIFTPWMFDRPLAIAACLTFASIALMWLLLKLKRLSARALAAFGLLYGVFAVLIAW
jgi:cation:H+ antiporter